LHFHYVVWQWQAARLAQLLHASEHFDRVHHVTYAGLRGPSFMGGFGIPFIFGPVGGGERAPWRLRQGYHFSGLIPETLRDIANLAVRFRLMMTPTFIRAAKIYVTSEQTLELIPRRYRDKAEIELAIASDRLLPLNRKPSKQCAGSFRVIYSGRFVDYKGMFLGLPAFAALLRARPDARLTMVGDGPRKKQWQQKAAQLGISANVDWLPWQPHEAMDAIYDAHDVMLFPSLHDAGGLVVLEALSMGLPVICLKLGGPGVIVTDACGRAIDVAGKSVTQVAEELADALIELSDDETRRSLTQFATTRCREFTWQQKIDRIYGLAS
jgi:glycosyltransferase involved in cell wall biosynthesis